MGTQNEADQRGSRDARLNPLIIQAPIIAIAAKNELTGLATIRETIEGIKCDVLYQYTLKEPRKLKWVHFNVYTGEKMVDERSTRTFYLVDEPSSVYIGDSPVVPGYNTGLKGFIDNEAYIKKAQVVLNTIKSQQLDLL